MQFDCKDFPHPEEGCKRLFLGKRQTEDLSLGLYRAVAKDTNIDQVRAFVHVKTQKDKIEALLR